MSMAQKEWNYDILNIIFPNGAEEYPLDIKQISPYDVVFLELKRPEEIIVSRDIGLAPIKLGEAGEKIVVEAQVHRSLMYPKVQSLYCIGHDKEGEFYSIDLTLRGPHAEIKMASNVTPELFPLKPPGRC